MVDNNDPIIAVDRGLRILIQVDTNSGHASARGEVVSSSQHSFRVKCTPPLPVQGMKEGQEVRISVATEANMIPVTTRYIRSAKDDPGIVILQIPQDRWRQNRRAFFRGDMSIPVRILKSDGIKMKGETINISGGGLLMVSAERLQLQEELQIILEFDGKDTVGARARVVWVSFDKEKGGRYGIKFVGINRREQNKICRLVQVKEFEDRRAELKELVGRT